MDHIKSPSQKNLISKGQQVSPKSHRNLYILRKAERARLNPQDVGGHESETLYVSFEWAKQPEDLARATSQEKRKPLFRPVRHWSLQLNLKKIHKLVHSLTLQTFSKTTQKAMKKDQEYHPDLFLQINVK